VQQRKLNEKPHMRKQSLGLLLVLLFLTADVLAQQQRGPSTPEERARFVDIVNKIQANPLDSSLRSDREWALLWLIQVPDVHASVCPNVLGPFIKSKYKYSSEIIGLLTFASGKFSIEHPDQSANKNAMYFAAVEDTLAGYEAILRQKPNAHSKPLDDLLQQKNNGTLGTEVSELGKNCK
jgi:hypothetical protein